MHIAQGAVQVGLVVGADMGHAALVVAHAHRGLQVLQRQAAFTHRQLAVHIPGTAQGQAQQDHQRAGQHQGSCFHVCGCVGWLTV